MIVKWLSDTVAVEIDEKRKQMRECRLKSSRVRLELMVHDVIPQSSCECDRFLFVFTWLKRSKPFKATQRLFE